METTLEGSYSLPRAERLRGKRVVSGLFTQGESGFVYPLRYLYCESKGSSSAPRVLFSVPKRFHKRANKRNLLRRRMKEAYRLQKAIIAIEGNSLDIAFIYVSKEALDYAKIARSVERILQQIASR